MADFIEAPSWGRHLEVAGKWQVGGGRCEITAVDVGGAKDANSEKKQAGKQ